MPRSTRRVCAGGCRRTSAEGHGATLTQLRRWIDSFHAIVTEQKAYLTELDSAIGDADHGINMSRGMNAVAAKLDASSPSTISELFKTVGMTLVSTVGGASGPLYGTFFLRIGASAADAEELDGQALAAAMQSALDGVVARGKAQVGDKTMVDALAPAVEALTHEVESGSSVADAAGRAQEAAERGSESTTALIARRGRASYLGERSIGHLDPGAVSTTLLFTALAKALA